MPQMRLQFGGTMQEPIVLSLKIERISKTEIETANTHKEVHVLTAKDVNNAVPKITLMKETPFDGYKPDGFIRVTIENDQTALSDFNEVTGNAVKDETPIAKDLKERRAVKVKKKR